MNTIFTVTTIWEYYKSRDTLHVHKRRCVGAFATLEKAKQAVEENFGDIFEDDTWKHCVIEEFELDGVYSIGDQKQWYLSDHTKFVPCDKPEVYESTCNFGIG